MQFHYFISFHLCIREKAFKLQEDRNKMLGLIDRMHKSRPKKYSFVYVLIGLTSLVCKDKIQKKGCLRARLVSLVSLVSVTSVECRAPLAALPIAPDI